MSEKLRLVPEVRALQDKLYSSVQGLQKRVQTNQWALNELGVKDPLALLPESAQPLARGLVGRILEVTPQEALRNLAYSGGKWYLPPALGYGEDGRPGIPPNSVMVFRLKLLEVATVPGGERGGAIAQG